MMNDQPEEGPPDHPAPSMDLTAVQQSTSNSMDNSAKALPPAADEESPREEKRMVEPQLVLEDVIQSSNPAIRFLRGRSAKGLNRMSSTVIDIAQLPPDVAENLRPYDLNGDGMISLTELVHGAITQHQQEENVRPHNNDLLKFDNCSRLIFKFVCFCRSFSSVVSSLASC